ncbi:hypothetical protein HMPREF9413_2658 [Paenibacillus sp. HGF7]|nr:hypothetical protein HMPREF9413_2658 [Paenibacillus sp. HGF7]
MRQQAGSFYKQPEFRLLFFVYGIAGIRRSFILLFYRLVKA